MVSWLGSEQRWQFLRGQPWSSDSSGGCLDAGSLQRLGSRVRRGPRLGDERRTKRALAGDQVLVASVESLDVALVGRTVGLLVPAVAPAAGQHQVPHPVDRGAPNYCAERPGEDMVDLGLAARRAVR